MRVVAVVVVVAAVVAVVVVVAVVAVVVVVVVVFVVVVVVENKTGSLCVAVIKTHLTPLCRQKRSQTCLDR